ncbi:PTS glucitol/sorbitol transporter subunit IIA [Micropruina sp.]|uniref:PTS glucitol/sorbitol transporter subunit IIA n=1 Tax=Micropruina sp. TaxID=2737536 RepID=UPI0039E5998B
MPCVLFGDSAPPIGADRCYTIAFSPATADIQPGDNLIFDGIDYPITAVGSLVRKNLDGPKVISRINVDGSTDAVETSTSVV